MRLGTTVISTVALVTDTRQDNQAEGDLLEPGQGGDSGHMYYYL